MWSARQTRKSKVGNSWVVSKSYRECADSDVLDLGRKVQQVAVGERLVECRLYQLW